MDVNIAGNEAGHPKSYFSPYENRNLKDGVEGEYLTERLSLEAVQYLEDGNPETKDLAFRTRPVSVIRWKNWKLIENYEDNSLELYNLQTDLSEKTNQAEAFPDVVKEMHDKLNTWKKHVNAPVPNQVNPEYQKTQ